jgi:hypothetical protein
MTTTAAANSIQTADFWRVARRLYAVYAELDRTFELGMPVCAELETATDPAAPEAPEAMERAGQWFDQIDQRVQVWQLRQLLQSTGLQNEENLRYLIARHLEKQQKTESDKDKINFLLVQYFAHCSPQGLNQLSLAEVARVLEPALGSLAQSFPEWAASLDDKLKKLDDSSSLEELQNSGALQEVRELKLAVGDDYFAPGFLVAFTRFNFLARRAFFKAMHQDLHAIRAAVNQLEQRGISTVDCRDAGLTENESLEQVRHVVHQWKTPFRAPYSGGSSFLQLILLRHALQYALAQAHQVELAPGVPAQPVAPFAAAPARAVAAIEEIPVVAVPAPVAEMATETPAEEFPVLEVNTPAEQAAPDLISRPAQPQHAGSAPTAEEQAEEEDYLLRCVADIADQLKAIPAKNSPSVSAIVLGGCKLLIATWEAQAFSQEDPAALVLQRTVAARTILHVCMERHKKSEPTDLAAALDIARAQVTVMKEQVEKAKESKNIDAAVNLAATSKRLLSLIAEGEKLL